MMDDRRVHATLPSGDLIVRLDRAGKWYRESEGQRFPIPLSLAVTLATTPGSTPHLGVSGGRAFDARVRTRLDAQAELREQDRTAANLG